MKLDALTRRKFIQGTTLAALAAHPVSKALAAELGNRHLLLIGTSGGRNGGGKGVYKVAFDSTSGALEVLDVTECNSPQVMALSKDQKVLFTLNGGFMTREQAAAAAEAAKAAAAAAEAAKGAAAAAGAPPARRGGGA